MSKEMMKPTSKDLEFSTFYVGTTLCGINILKIEEINKHFNITTVPQSSDYIKGILNLRGRIITIIDLGKKLGLDSVEKNKDTRNIIVNSNDEHIGLVVNGISDVVVVREDDIEAVPSNINGVKGKNFKGVLKTEKQLIGILDIDEILKE
ncbi:MAG: chemotaxis protein CheW [Desulfobacula sp.]|nr:chemotaxis protein CheW [Desulfobacula sp.]